MSKTVLKTKEEFDAAIKLHIRNYFNENPIYEKLNLTQDQMEVLIKEEIMPKFKEEYEFESRIMKQWFNSK